MIRLAACVLTFAALPLGVAAQSLQELRPDFMAGCVDYGNDAPTCGCIFDNWSKTVTPDQEPLARTAITMFLGEMPQNTQDMMAATAMVQNMTSVLLQCASGALEVTEPASQPIPETGDALEDRLLLERVATGGTIEGTMRYAAVVQARKAREQAEIDASKVATDNRAALNRAALAADHEAELARIHSREITAWQVQDFQPLFDLNCRYRFSTNVAPSVIERERL